MARPLLLHFTAPDCVPCAAIAPYVAKQCAERGLERIELDVSTDTGFDMRTEHRVTSFPTFVLLDATGREELGRCAGADEAAFRALLDTHAIFSPTRQICSLPMSAEATVSARCHGPRVVSHPQATEAGRGVVRDV